MPDQPTEKLIRVPADTWRLVVEALEFTDGRADCPDGLILKVLDDSWGECAKSRCARKVRTALERARKVQP